MPAAVPLANAPVMTARACIAVLSVGLPVAAVFEAFNVAALGLRFSVAALSQRCHRPY